MEQIGRISMERASVEWKKTPFENHLGRTSELRGYYKVDGSILQRIFPQLGDRCVHGSLDRLWQGADMILQVSLGPPGSWRVSVCWTFRLMVNVIRYFLFLSSWSVGRDTDCFWPPCKSSRVRGVEPGRNCWLEVWTNSVPLEAPLKASPEGRMLLAGRGAPDEPPSILGRTTAAFGLFPANDLYGTTII